MTCRVSAQDRSSEGGFRASGDQQGGIRAVETSTALIATHPSFRRDRGTDICRKRKNATVAAVTLTHRLSFGKRDSSRSLRPFVGQHIEHAWPSFDHSLGLSLIRRSF